MDNETTDIKQAADVAGRHERVVMRVEPARDTEVCPECGMNHDADVVKKEYAQERIRQLRLALRIATGWDGDKYKEYMEAAEDQMTAIKSA